MTGGEPRRRLRTVMIPASGIAVGVVATLLVSNVLSSRAVPVAATAGSVSALEIDQLEQPQRAVDRIAPDFGTEILPDSVRILNESSTMMAASGSTLGLFAARKTDNRICLIAVQPDGQYAMSCSTPAEFPSSGLVVDWRLSVGDQELAGSATWTPAQGELSRGQLPSRGREPRRIRWVRSRCRARERWVSTTSRSTSKGMRP